MELKIKLEAQDFSDRTPTKTQIANVLEDMSQFLNRVGGALMATGEYHIAEQDGPPQANPIAALLNAAGSVKNAKQLFESGNSSGLVSARPQAVPMR